MEQLPAFAILESPLPACSHIYPKGRRCRQAVMNADAIYCAIHAPKHRTNAAALAAKLKGISSYGDITHFLIGVINLLAEDRISARRAAVFTYIANSIRQAAREEDRADERNPAPPIIELGDLDKNRSSHAEKSVDEFASVRGH